MQGIIALVCLWIYSVGLTAIVEANPPQETIEERPCISQCGGSNVTETPDLH